MAEYNDEFIEECAEEAFNAYTQAVGGIAHDGTLIRATWETLSPTARGEGWRAAVRAVLMHEATK